MKHLALALGVLLLACSDPGAGPTPDAAPLTSPPVDLVIYRGSEGSSYLGVSFAQADRSGCDATDFLLPGEQRVEDDVIQHCPIATCVSEVRLLRGEEVLDSRAVDPQDSRVSFEYADGSGLALELRGCGEPRRVPLWESSLPQGATVSLVPGEPGNAIRIATDMPAANVSLMSAGQGGLGGVREHSLAGATSVRVAMPGYQTYVSVDEIEANGSVVLDGIEVRRWSGQGLYGATLCLPVGVDDHWDIGCASRNGTTAIAIGAPGSESVVALRASSAVLDRPDASGYLTWKGDAVDTSSGDFTGFELAQGAATDTVGLRRRSASPLVGPLYQATTTHVEPGEPLGFGIAGDEPTFTVTYGAIHFVNTEDASDTLDVEGLAFRWSVVHIVPRP